MLGHNNEYACRFYECMDKLKKLGLKGEVSLTAGLVMVSVQGKENSKPWRKAIKTACNKTGVIFAENRPMKDLYLFSIKV